jgi:hypothetical protein
MPIISSTTQIVNNTLVSKVILVLLCPSIYVTIQHFSTWGLGKGKKKKKTEVY